MNFELNLSGRRWRADLSQPRDISIPLLFDGPQPHCFGAAAASATTFEAGTFMGDVRGGGSCNCMSYALTPHCNGTHTECVGHLTREPVSIRDTAPSSFLVARLATVQPQASAGDLRITLDALQRACAPDTLRECQALVLRTLPNGPDKLGRNYDVAPSPPYMDPAAIQWLVEGGIEHLLVDLPSVDRPADGGRLQAHRIFWGMPAGATDAGLATRPRATITELIYVPHDIADGVHLLNLQIAPFAADAAPSRPVLYPLVPQ